MRFRDSGFAWLENGLFAWLGGGSWVRGRNIVANVCRSWAEGRACHIEEKMLVVVGWLISHSKTMGSRSESL